VARLYGNPCNLWKSLSISLSGGGVGRLFTRFFPASHRFVCIASKTLYLRLDHSIGRPSTAGRGNSTVRPWFRPFGLRTCYRPDGMVVRPYRNVFRVSASAFPRETAAVIGDVVLGDDVSVWYSSVVRGDCCSIRVGARSNIQDNCTLHVTNGVGPLLLEEEVTLEARRRGPRLHDPPRALIGMNARPRCGRRRRQRAGRRRSARFARHEDPSRYALGGEPREVQGTSHPTR
jgi:hypothetical protein